MRAMTESISSVVPALEKVSGDVLQEVIEEQDRRTIGAGTVRRDGLESVLTSCLELEPQLW
jgi:hypothetical protein